ncbi:uncharacterized protein LOC143234454 [Tachypleus tridentatus]|uniref:uncharacterized protein LOC143234454 n=1 Tax=Tachypleus tridentatus TaxID=6853 RepID=UPI003FCF905F
METDREYKLNIPTTPVSLVFTDMSDSERNSPSDGTSLSDEVFISAPEVVEELTPSLLEEELNDRYYEIINTMSDEFQSVIKNILENRSSQPSTSDSYLSTNVQRSKTLKPDSGFDIPKRQARSAEPCRSRPQVLKLRQRSATYRHIPPSPTTTKAANFKNERSDKHIRPRSLSPGLRIEAYTSNQKEKNLSVYQTSERGSNGCQPRKRAASRTGSAVRTPDVVQSEFFDITVSCVQDPDWDIYWDTFGWHWKVDDTFHVTREDYDARYMGPWGEEDEVEGAGSISWDQVKHAQNKCKHWLATRTLGDHKEG